MYVYMWDVCIHAHTMRSLLTRYNIAVCLPATYVSVTQAMMSLSTLFNIFIIHLHHRGIHGWQMPKWQKHIFFTIGRLMCFETTLGHFNDELAKVRLSYLRSCQQ